MNPLLISMAEKGGTKILITITICVMLVSVGFSGCIGNDDKKENDNNEITYKYWYEIVINGTFHKYHLNVPIPVYIDKIRILHISPIIDELKVAQGNASFEIENTTYGPSLKINGQGNIKINLSGNDLSKYKLPNQNSRLFLSMAFDKNNDGYYYDEYDLMKYRIYCRQNLTLNIIIKFYYLYFGEPGISADSYSEMQGEITQGWNIINGTFYTAQA